jgi:hypothetical protein
MSVFRHTNRSRCKPTRTHFQVWITAAGRGWPVGRPSPFCDHVVKRGRVQSLVIRNTSFYKSQSPPHTTITWAASICSPRTMGPGKPESTVGKLQLRQIVRTTSARFMGRGPKKAKRGRPKGSCSGPRHAPPPGSCKVQNRDIFCRSCKKNRPNQCKHDPRRPSPPATAAEADLQPRVRSTTASLTYSRSYIKHRGLFSAENLQQQCAQIIIGADDGHTPIQVSDLEGTAKPAVDGRCCLLMHCRASRARRP